MVFQKSKIFLENDILKTKDLNKYQIIKFKEFRNYEFWEIFK